MKKINILFIEDNKTKAEEIKNFVIQNNDSLEITIKESFTSGLRELFTGNYDLLFLDMSLPSREGISSSTINNFEQLGGYKILSEMKRKNYYIPTIVISMFSEFGVGQSYMNLKELDDMFLEKFDSFYKGYVFYSAKQDELWKIDLLKALAPLI